VREIATLPAAQSHHCDFGSTGEVYFWAEVQPLDSVLMGLLGMTSIADLHKVGLEPIQLWELCGELETGVKGLEHLLSLANFEIQDPDG
jgi:hypothetical protein